MDPESAVSKTVLNRKPTFCLGPQVDLLRLLRRVLPHYLALRFIRSYIDVADESVTKSFEKR